ncbi:MAG: preQ(1) synthase [Candidatus Firestonebacteria bacterium]|nr:preQ(1) synthase [Candidatus Firestonebacteria bacterium]
MKKQYTDKHAIAGVKTLMPALECFPNQFKNYVITIDIPEYSSICPKSGLPDCGKLVIKYIPGKNCLELKSLKLYILAYRNLGIFYENATNKILADFVKAVKPQGAYIKGEFTPRGGISTSVEAAWGKPVRLSDEK